MMGMFDRLLGRNKKKEPTPTKRSRPTAQKKMSPPLKGSGKYFEVPDPDGDGYCSDNACPCPDVKIPRGTGYLYVSQEVADFRRNARSVEEAQVKLRAAITQALGPGAGHIIGGLPSAILMCKRGANLRKLDLEVAAADAKYWWKTGLAPLRATPTVKKTTKVPKK